MGWESFGVDGFDLGLLLRGHTWIANTKSAYSSLIIHHRKSCGVNLLMLSDLTLDP